MPNKFSVIIRYYNRSKQRERNLRLILSHIRTIPEAEIILSTMQTDIVVKDQRIIRKFTPDSFESARANNIGASIATTDVLIFQDADVLFDTSLYYKALAELGKHDSVRIGERVYDLIDADVNRLRQFDDLNVGLAKIPKRRPRDAPGACWVITRDAFVEIGGYSELFKVYGWEDCYFKYKVNKLSKVKSIPGHMFHLPHETNYQMGQQPVNNNLFRDLVNTNGGDCVQHSKRDRIDLLKKYPNLKCGK